MTPIKPEHWAHFVQLCKNASQHGGIELTPEMARDAYIAEFGSGFPETQGEVGIPVTSLDVLAKGNDTGVHLLAVVCGTLQPREGIDGPSIGIKAINMQSTDQVFALFEYDVFENGRLVLECVGLRLDTLDEACAYEPGGAFADDLERGFASRPDLGEFSLGCVMQFPTTGPKGDELKLKIHAELMTATEWDTAEA